MEIDEKLKGLPVSTALDVVAPPPKPFKGWPKFNVLRRFLFMDVDGLIAHGYRTRIEPQDLYEEPTFRTDHLMSLFEPAVVEQKALQVTQVQQAREELAAHQAKHGVLVKPPAPEEFIPAGPVGRGPPPGKGGPPPGKGGPPGGPGGPPAKKEPKPKLSKPAQRQAALEKSIVKGSNMIDLRRVMLKGNTGVLLFTAFLYLLSNACSLAGPLLLQRIVAGLQCQSVKARFPNASCDDKTTLYYYCIGLFLAPLVQSLAENHQTLLLYTAGTRMRNALMAAIYRKCLCLSNSSLQQESTGRVVTLMSNDAQKLQDAMFAIHSMWGSPCYIIAVLVLLWYQVGWATFVGLAVMTLLGPMSGKLAAKLGGLRREILQWTDKRVGFMNEVISGIQMIKFYAWEVPFTDRVQSARSQEARILRVTAVWQGLFGMILFSGPVLVAIFCFGAWTLGGHELTNANAYAALALFSLLRFPMSFLPMLITMIVNALVALKRIGAFLNKSESELSKEVLDMNYPAGEVKIEEGEFTWDTTQAKSTLKGINLQAKPGTLTMIVGGVGSGKSSILGALVGHISKTQGTVKVGGKVAYVPQTAWIMNDTLQENVLLGNEAMDPDRYRLALKVSQLGPDLEILPNGDVTEIGDRGVTLSGGQKQRVSIARAVYYDADVYILDDPLSAVDSHVGRALFEECIRGPLKDKTVILVTNALQYLPFADNVLWMENGAVRAQGTYNQLVEQGLNIAELTHMDDDDSDDEANKEVIGGMADHKAVPAVIAAALSPGPGGKRTSRDRRSKELARAVTNNKVTLTRSDTSSNRNLTGVEEREMGNLSWDVVSKYFSAGGGKPVVITLILLYCIEQGARVYTDRWVGVWASNTYNKNVAFYLGIYFGLGCFYGVTTFIRSLRFLFLCVNAAVNLHNMLLTHLLRLPKTFFDTNPSGRILNRFSRDTDIMDATLSASLMQFTGCVATYISILIVISIVTKWLAVALVPLTIVYFIIQRYYIPTARELQRIESISRSPIYSKFTEALLGVSTIRAYRKEEHFTKVSDGLMETNAFAFITQKLAASWLAMRLDFLGLLVVTGCGVLVIQGNVDPGLAGLALVYALDLTRFLKHGTNMASKSEADFNSVERILQYLRPEPEAAADTTPEVQKTLPPDWPDKGTIEVKELKMRYRPEMPLVLHGVTFTIEGGEKVGLVGRTGSGKSSIFQVLFRMVEPTSGSIIIDGVETRTLGVRHLRSKMSIIPQDPFMFSGTVRHNLDPFQEHMDDRLWEVLQAVGLKQVISELEGGIGAKVVDNGANFSLGQRQLFCMARAMLRNSRILMLDEATASVDVDTDALIQYSIREVFAEVTTLTIAHRLNTIMDSDKVVVLEAGKVIECDHADVLLQKEAGIFTGMVNQTGKSSARYLKSLASSSRQASLQGIRLAPSFKSTMSFNSGASFRKPEPLQLDDVNGGSPHAPGTAHGPSPGPFSPTSLKSPLTPSRLRPAAPTISEEDAQLEAVPADVSSVSKDSSSSTTSSGPQVQAEIISMTPAVADAAAAAGPVAGAAAAAGPGQLPAQSSEVNSRT